MKNWFSKLLTKIFNKLRGRETYFEKNGERLRGVAKSKGPKLEKAWGKYKEPKEDPIEFRAKKLKKLERGE